MSIYFISEYVREVPEDQLDELILKTSQVLNRIKLVEANSKDEALDIVSKINNLKNDSPHWQVDYTDNGTKFHRLVV